MKRISILASIATLCLPLILAGCDKGAEERAKLESELAELKIASQKTSSEKATLKTELDEATQARDDLQAQVTKLTGEEGKLRGQIDKLTGTSQRLDGEVTNLAGSLEKLTGQLKEITDSRNQLRKDVAELKSARDALRAQVAELTKQRDDAIAKEQQTQRELAILTAQAKAEGKKVSGPDDGLVAIKEAPTVPDETPVVEGPARPTVHSFASARTKVDKGQSATLTWHVSNASEILIEPGVGSVSALGSTNVKPTKTTTYTLTATNDSGRTVETCKVEVR
jgi:peptidoglycan hydrolase CwlO-like protein